MIERRVRSAKFPATKSLDSFDFKALPDLNKVLVLEQARAEFIIRRENIIALEPSGTGKTHLAMVSAWQLARRMTVGFITAAARLVNQLTLSRIAHHREGDMALQTQHVCAGKADSPASGAGIRPLGILFAALALTAGAISL
jgi:DNA replication protein DnaC